MPLLLLALLAEGMVVVPEGEFWMGRPRLWLIDEIGWQAEVRMDDRPLHRVHLDAFAVDRYEVTHEDYARFVEETGREKPFHWRLRMPERMRLPIYNVSFEDARAYCAWAGKRLPTEAEWEKAARGGLEETAYPWGDVLEPSDESDDEEDSGTRQMAHYGYPEGPTEVGSFVPNGYGLYDMVGNVWEWVADGYEQHYYSVSPGRNPRGPEDASYRVIRGGSWAEQDDRILTVFYRNYTDPDTRTSTIGFRCASDLPAAE